MWCGTEIAEGVIECLQSRRYCLGKYVFDNEAFDVWLSVKSQEILSKVDRETITTEEMIILVLKAQTNHFHHMDQDFRGEFGRVNNQFEEVQEQFKEIKNEFKEVRSEIKDQSREMNDRFDRMNRFLMWQGGVIMALFSGLYLKLFLG